MSSTSVFPRFDPFADLSAGADEKAATLSQPYCDACHSAHVASEPSISLVDCCCSTLSQSCLAAYINHYVARKAVTSIPCPQPACGKELTTAMIQSILAPADFEAYLHATLVAFIEQDQHSFICPNDACKAVISIAPFSPPPIPDPIPEKDEDGRVLTAEAWLHFCEFRVRCRECNLIFCASCKTSPYHKGYTCSAFKDYQSARHCRFCTQRLDGSNQYRHPSSSIALKDVCTEEECVKKAELSCERMLPCGCPCQGIKAEISCLPCLKHDLNIAEEFCPVCYVEELKAAPCIKMTGPCTHVVHYQCALTKISSRWPGARISFEFRTCPVCKQNMAHPGLEAVLEPVIAMESGIIEKAMQRLKYEARENDPAITQKGADFYQNAVGFAMKNYLFYQCFKCQRPYFAGGYQCVDASVQGFDPSELICPSCQPSSVEDCKVHGKDWLAYKCRYCCSFANWYCLTDDMEVLTDRGFMLRAEVFAACPELVASMPVGDAARPSPAASSSPLRFASLDPSTGHLVYLQATALTVKTVTSLVEFTHEAEAPHWAADADEYGLTPDQVARMQHCSERDRDGEAIERGKERVSNGVSLVVDPHHDMFARVGWARSKVDHTVWQSTDYRKVKAGALLSDDTRQRVRMTGQAAAGLAASADELPFAPVLGLTTEDEVTAFLLLYGYWLGAGSLEMGHRSLLCSLKKPEDQPWLLAHLATLGLTVQSGGVTTSGDDRNNGQRNIVICDPRWTDYFFAERHENASLESSTALRLAVPNVKSVKGFWMWVWRLRKERARLILAGLRFADGKEAGDENVIFTAGYQFRDDIIRLALHAGYSSRCRLVHKAGNHVGYDAAGAAIVAQHDGWEVSYSDRLSNAQPVLNNHSDIKRIDVPSGVQTWCPTVPPHNLIIARRVTKNASGVVTQASRPIVVGNCWGNTHFCDKCHKSGVWQQLTVFRSGKNKKKLWEYDNCSSLQPQVDAIGKDNSLSEDQKTNALAKLLSAPKACVLGVRHPPTGIEFGLGCSMCEDSQSSSEKLKENEAAVKAKLAVVKDALGRQPRTFVYRSDLDENGVMWFLGTCGRTQPYQNPAEAGFVRVISSGLMGDSAPLSAAVGRELVRCVTTPVKNSWFVFELVDLQLALTHYTLRHYNSWDTECLRHWQLEGSNESVQGPWELIIQHTNDESLRKKGATHTWQVPNTGKRYKLFRLFQNGRNSNKNYYLPCSGLEFYGTLYVNDAPESVSSPSNKLSSPRSAKPAMSPPPIPPPRPLIPPPSIPLSQPTAVPRTFTYRSDLDQSGICHWLGTRCGTVPSYSNPADMGLVRVRCSELAKDGAPINAVVGRDVVRVVSVPKPNQWFVIDFSPSGYRIRPTAYTLRHYASWDLEALRNWKLEGSINGNDWFVLSVHADDQALNGKGSLHTWQLGTQQGQFTQFRIWQTGLNSNNHHYLALSGFEVYGDVYPNSPPLATPFDAVRAISVPALPQAAGVYPHYSQQPYPVQVPLLPPPPVVRPHSASVPIIANGHMPRPPPVPPASSADPSHSHHAPPPVASPSGSVIPFRYQHDMDTNGLFYYLGTRGRTAPWSNPCNQRLVSITCSALATNPPSAPCSALVNRELVRCVTQAKPDMWFVLDLGNVLFHCTHYTLQHYASFDVEALRNWRFEASQDGNTWDVLREHVNDQALQKAGQTHTWPIMDTPQTQGRCYRLFRIWQTGLNSNNNHYLALSGIEFYGWLPIPGAMNRTMPPQQAPPAMPAVPPRLPTGPPLPPTSPPLSRPPPLPTAASTPPLAAANNNPFAYNVMPVSRPTLSSPPSGPPPPPMQPRPPQPYPVSSWPPHPPMSSPSPPSQPAAPSPPASNGYNPFADSPPLQPSQPVQHQPPPVMGGGGLNSFGVSAPAAQPSPSSSPPPPPLLSSLSINVSPATPAPYASPSSSRASYQPLSTPSPRSPPALLPPPFPEGMSFEYSYDFDEGGILYYLGTKQRTAQWRNPDDLGVVRVTSVPLAVSPPSAPASAIVGREVVRCVTQPNRESWFCVDLLSFYCRPTHYTLRHYDSFDSEALRDWKLQGSNDGKKWSKLVSHKKDECLNGKGSSHTWEIPAAKKAYRMFRILQTGKNSNGHWYCALSGFELYGQLYTQPPKVKE